MAKNIRSEYVKNLLEDKEALEKQLKGITESTIKSLLEDEVKGNLRQIISEDANSFEEEEVTDDDTKPTDEPKDDDTSTDDVNVADDDVTATDGEEDGTGDDDEAADDADVTDADGTDDTGDDDVWSGLEDYKGEDGEYDLTGMDAEDVIKVLKVMKPEDGVRVVKNDDGNIELTDDETNKEYIIQLDVDDESCDGCDDDDSLGEAENHGNVGYTDDYQKKTAMTTPDNHEPADPSKTYSMDGGVPTGTEKPFPGKGDNAPFDKDVNEAMTTQEQGAYNRGTVMVHTNTNSKAAKGRNSHAGGKQIHGTADNSYSEAQMESIKRKANEIFRENKELKSLLPNLKKQLQEAIVINQSLGNIVKLLKENATTADEKQSIIKRFNDVKTCNESNSLYKTITEELHRTHQTQNVDNVLNAQLSEATKHTVETPMYQSDDLTETLDFMRRLDRV